MPKAKNKKKAAARQPETPKNVERKVLYPEIRWYRGTGDDALTAEKVKTEVLGWEEEVLPSDDNPNGVKFGNDYQIMDRNGLKIRCQHNAINRSIDEGKIETLMREMLHKRWKYNGEPIIVGKTGQLINGQKTCFALVFAQQELEGKNAARWTELWPDGVIRIEKSITFGVDETDDVVNTVDTAQPRGIDDVIYRSHYFSSSPPAVRKQSSRMTAHAIKMLWHRTGVTAEAFSPGRATLSELTDFLDRHPKLLKAVKHIMSENADGGLGHLLSPGYASAVLYLMAACRTDGDAYRAKEAPNEKDCNLEEWDKAEEFWRLLISAAKKMQEVRHAIGALTGVDGEGRATTEEKMAILCKAWNLYVEDTAITEEDLELLYSDPDEDGVREFLDEVDVGGIDLGEQKAKAKPGRAKKAKEEPEPEEEPDREEETTEEPADPAKAERIQKIKEAEERRKAKAASNGKPNAGLKEELEAIQAANPGKMLLFKSADCHRIWQPFHAMANKVLDANIVEYQGLKQVVVKNEDFDDAVKKLSKAGHKLAVVVNKDGKVDVTDIGAKGPPRPKAKK